MESEHAKENYRRFSNSPDRIDGAVHNMVSVRRGVAFDYRVMKLMDAVEIGFTVEPHGNMRSVMVVDIAAAKALLDALDAVLATPAGESCWPFRTPEEMPKTYRVPDGKGDTTNVTIPEE